MQAFGNLLNIMSEEWKVKDDYKRREMQKNQRLVRIMAKLCVGSVVASSIFYTVFKIYSVGLLQKNDVSDDSNVRPLLLSSKFFFKIESAPVYVIIALCQFLSSIILGFIYGCYEGLFIIFIFHLCSQLKILKIDVKNLINQSKKQTFASAVKPIIDTHSRLKW